MRPYEAILNKIAPTFYRLAKYYDYFYENRNEINFYLYDFKIIDVYMVSFYHNFDFDYFYSSSFIYPNLRDSSKNEITRSIVVRLMPKNKIDEELINSHILHPDEVLVNTVLNKFSFENNRMRRAKLGLINVTYKDLIIALVGKDMYETIRNNIK